MPAARIVSSVRPELRTSAKCSGANEVETSFPVGDESGTTGLGTTETQKVTALRPGCCPGRLCSGSIHNADRGAALILERTPAHNVTVTRHECLNVDELESQGAPELHARWELAGRAKAMKRRPADGTQVCGFGVGE